MASQAGGLRVRREFGARIAPGLERLYSGWVHVAHQLVQVESHDRSIATGESGLIGFHPASTQALAKESSLRMNGWPELSFRRESRGHLSAVTFVERNALGLAERDGGYPKPN